MFNIFNKQGTSKRSASTSTIGDREPGDMATPTGEQAMAGDMAIAGACEELSDAQLATCCGGVGVGVDVEAGVGERSAQYLVNGEILSFSGLELVLVESGLRLIERGFVDVEDSDFKGYVKIS